MLKMVRNISDQRGYQSLRSREEKVCAIMSNQLSNYERDLNAKRNTKLNCTLRQKYIYNGDYCYILEEV